MGFVVVGVGVGLVDFFFLCCGGGGGVVAAAAVVVWVDRRRWVAEFVSINELWCG